MDTSKIERYYDKTLPFYRLFWHRDYGSHALHCGFWDDQTKTMHEALINQNRFLADQVNLRPGYKVLDAGCGIGGSSIWLARHYGVNVLGITLGMNQAIRAATLARSNEAGLLTQFYVMDYVRTGFSADLFDVVWAIESVCHAENKEEFLKEAHRILKREGKIIVADAFLKRDIRDAQEETLIEQLREGFAVPNLTAIAGFERTLKTVGFKNVKYWDKTHAVKPSSRRMYVMCLISDYIFQIGQRFTVIDEVLRNSVLAGIAQYKAVKADLCGYLVFYGEK
jgi:tocopherol O-methyltransferase